MISNAKVPKQTINQTLQKLQKDPNSTANLQKIEQDPKWKISLIDITIYKYLCILLMKMTTQ